MKMIFKKLAFQQKFSRKQFSKILSKKRIFAGIATQIQLDRRISARSGHWPNLSSGREGIRVCKDR
jgi:hypothetical protein